MVLSGLYLDANDPASALAAATRARAVSQRAGRTRSVIAAMLQESVCQRALGRSEDAARTFYAAVDSLEGFRGGISTVEWREVFGQQVAGRVVDAARVLLESPPELPRAAREAAFFDAVQMVKTRALLDRITDPRFGASPAATQPVRLATLDDLQAVLRPGELVLDMHMGPKQAILAAVTADSLRLVELPGSDSPLADRVRLFRNLLASSNPLLREQYPTERMAEIQLAIGRDVLGDIADWVRASTRVIVAPDGYAAAIPFGTLMLGGDDDVLMVDRDVVQVPSASVLVLQRSTSRADCVERPSLVAIAADEPGLPGARAEVQSLARRYGSVSPVANIDGVQSLQEATRGCDVLHIAGHALVVDRSPWESGIRLAPTRNAIDAPRDRSNGDASQILPAADSVLIAQTFTNDPYVRAWQIAQIDVPAKLAVLSACETAGGRVTNGEGTLGITAAFLSAGVPVVVSSLWAIDDRATADIMGAFYRHLARRETVATALRLAQLEQARSRKHAHPFFWAGFTVVGDGSLVVEIEERPARLHAVALAALAVGVVLAAVAFIRRRRLAAAVG